MKETVVTIALAVFCLTSLSSTENAVIDPKIISAFEKEFSFAKHVKWESKEKLAQVRFLLNEQAVTAWYNSEAELVLMARNILYTQLPVSVMKSLEKNYPDAALFGMVEIIRNNEVHYQVTAEMKKKKLLLQITPAGYIIGIKRIK